jgi:type IV pilus assembly protein PilA
MRSPRKALLGLTIIEVIIVVAIIGIIAAVGLPAVRGYTLRAKVSEAVQAFSNCRNVVSEVYLSGNELPGVDNWGCEVERPSRFIERIRTTNEGKVIVTMGNEVNDLRLALHDLTIVPISQFNQPMREDDLGSPVRKWRCGYAADGTDVKAEYLPGSCRGGG